MIVIDKKNLIDFNNISLHDWQIKQIICNYDEYSITIPMSKHSIENGELKAKLIFEEVIYNEISYYELWGSGNYILECDVKDDYDIITKIEQYKKDEQFCCSRLTNFTSLQDVFVTFNITLNSGDIIKILACKVILEID